jgi:ferrochelatase
MTGYDAFLLVSFGGPERAEDVRPFLQRVTAGRGVPQDRLDEVAGHYFAAGGASPVNGHCRGLLEDLRPRMADLGLASYWGNRNWHPLLEDTLARMAEDGVQRAVAFVTSAYGGYSSCRQYLDDIATARDRVGRRAPLVDKLRLFYDHPGWVRPWGRSAAGARAECAAQLTAGGNGARTEDIEIVFTAHSIPVAAARTSPYVAHVTTTARLAAAAAGLGSWQLAWQSRSGSPASPWLGPDIAEVLGTSTAPGVAVVPIGFVCENMEVTHDLDVEAAAVARSRGMVFARAGAVNATAEFVDMVVTLVAERMVPGTGRAALGEDGPWPDDCPVGHCPPPYRIPVG